jgi:hypothetical protein
MMQKPGAEKARTTSHGMEPGDVLVSQSSARADVYDITVIPDMARESHARYEDAVEAGRQLAARLTVDGWFTSDHTHFACIARHR